MFASAGRAVARRLPVATSQLVSQALVLRPAIATRAFTISHEALQPKAKTSTDTATTKKPAAKKTEGAAKKSTKAKKASSDGEAPKKRAKKAKKPKAVKKEVTPEEKEAAKERAKVKKDRARLRELKKIALLDQEPKVVKESPWTRHVQEVIKSEGGGDFKTLILKAQESYKNLTTPEFEVCLPVLIHRVTKLTSIQELREKSLAEKTFAEAELKKWIESHSVEAIYNANKARRHLKLLGKKNIQVLGDNRFPKAIRTPYIMFSQARREEILAQDSTVPPPEVVSRIAEAWRNLTEEQKKPYEAAHQKDREVRGKALEDIRIRARELQRLAKETEAAEQEAHNAEKAEAAAERRMAKAAERAAAKNV